MTDRRTLIIAELSQNLKETIHQFQSLTAEELELKIYQDEVQWTIRRVLAHYITIEQSMHKLFRNMLAGGPGSSPDFDLQRFNRTQPAKLDGVAMNILLARFTAVRNETIAMVREMTDSDLDRKGRHVFHGYGTLERFIMWAYEHVRLHQKDVQSVLASGAHDHRPRDPA